MKKYTNKILAILAGFLIILVFSLIIVNNKAIFGATHPKNSISTSNLNTIKSINLNGSQELQIKQGKIESQNNLPSTAYIDNGTLFIDAQDGQQVIKLMLPQLKEINVAGAAKVTLDGFTAENVKLNSAGAAEFLVRHATFNNVVFASTGGSKLTFKDSHIKHLDLNATGAATIIVNSFESGSLSGTAIGDVTIHYSGNLVKNELTEIGQVKVMR